MKRQTKLIFSISATAIMAISVLAQNTSMADTNTPGRNRQMSRSELAESLKFTDLKGLTVESQQNEKLGKIQDLAVDLKSGRIIEAVISSGGFMGADSTLRAVPPRALHHDTDLKTLQLNIDKDKFNGAPTIDTATWDAGMGSNRVVEVYSYYGERPYFVTGYSAYDTNLDGTVAGALSHNMDGNISTTAGRTLETAHNAEVAATNQDGTVADNGMSGTYPNRLCGLGQVDRASRLIGMSVTNLQNETIGNVENLIVDLSAGRVVAVVISTGGFMGMGGEYSAVPPSAFSFNDSTNALQLDVSKESIANSPHFSSSKWPDFSRPEYTAGVYHAYNVQPYFAQDADNTGRNVRDRNNQTLTPMDQGNSQADINTTAQIRKEIIRAGKLSVNAENCKIITKDGQVTLRGPVNSEDEKNRIAEIAKQAVPEASVNNQLEVVSNNKQ